MTFSSECAAEHEATANCFLCSPFVSPQFVERISEPIVLSEPQFEFLRVAGEPGRPGRKTAPFGTVNFSEQPLEKRAWLLEFETLGAVRLIRNSIDSIQYAVITARGWEYLYSRGIESTDQYQARRQGEQVTERAKSIARREQALARNLTDLDAFLGTL